MCAPAGDRARRGEPLVVARSKQYRYADHGMSIEVSNKNGFYAAFTCTPA